MTKYNKYSIGDIVGHQEAPTLKFRIIDVLPGVPEKEGNYGYAKSQIYDENEMESIFTNLNDGIYIEDDLFFIRKPTLDELKKILAEALEEVTRFEGIAASIRSEMDKLKSNMVT